jgi:HEAT repeat protein
MAITAEKIKQWGEKGKVKKLIKCLKVDDMDIPGLAAEGLGKLGDPRAVEPLGQILKDPNCTHISQIKAVTALGEIGGDSAIDCLIDALGFGPVNVRAAVADLLEKMDNDTILEKLRDKLKHMEWVFRSRSAQLLGQMKDEKAVDPLIKRLKDKNEKVRQAAAEALGNIGDKKAVEPLIEYYKSIPPGKGKTGLRFDKKRDELAVQRQVAALALGKIGDPRAIEPLKNLLVMDCDFAFQDASQALKMLGWIPSKDEIGARYYIQLRQFDQCVEIGEPAVRPLIEKFNDPGNPTYRVAEALKKIYKSKQISPENKKAILQLKGKVIDYCHTDEKKFDPDTCHKDHSDSKHKEYFKL